MEFTELIEAAKASTKNYTPAAQALRLAAAAGEIAGTFAVPVGTPGDGLALAIAVGKTAVAAIGVEHLFNEPTDTLVEPVRSAEVEQCGEDIAGWLLTVVAKAARGPWPEDNTQEVLDLLGELVQSVGLPGFMQCCRLYLQQPQ
jgi:hypothetical protein